MTNKYYDTPSVIQVIGCVFNEPSLLDLKDKYSFNEEDFTVEPFHKILFGSIYNLYELGVKNIDILTIENYLEQRPKSFAIYQANNGAKYLKEIQENAQPAAFDFYYMRMKKMTLLRMYSSIGMDLKWLYDVDNIFDAKKKQLQEEWLDNHSLNEIADVIDKKICDIRMKYASNKEDDFIQAGAGIEDLLKRLETNPEIGYPLYGSLINTVHRGARLKKLYLRSAVTGLGKTRYFIADACSIACDTIYNPDKGMWEDAGVAEPTMFIATEQDEEEIQTLLLSFVSAVDEESILTGRYLAGEKERVLQASKILARSPLYIKKMPNFSLQDIENAIRYGVREWGCKYICFDYLHSSMKILSEIGTRSGVKGLREDNILFLISVKLKDLCNEYGIFIETGTQLNGAYADADVYDQNLLRGRLLCCALIYLILFY